MNSPMISIEEVASRICSKEREILDEFCKAFIAHKSLEGIPIHVIFQEYTLCVKHLYNLGGESKFWFEKKHI